MKKRFLSIGLTALSILSILMLTLFTVQTRGNVSAATPLPKTVASLGASATNYVQLNGIAVVSETDVWAVGYYVYSGNSSETGIEHWNGTSWNVVPSPNPSGLNSYNLLSSVAAVSTTDVWAVGYYCTSCAYSAPQTLIEQWNGSTWNVVPTTQSQTNLPYPSWWNGTTCDTNKVSNSAPLGTYYRGMPACGPIGLPANSTTEVTFPGPTGKAGWGEYEWQCVELSMRYMYLAYGVYAYNANGNQVVDNYQNSTYDPYNYNNPILIPVTNNGSSKTAPQAGDILSYTTTASPGHTSVVTASNVDSSGNGTITVIEQNSSKNGNVELKVGANANKSPWVIGSGVKNWLHHTVDLTPQSAHASATVVVNGTGFAANEKVSIKFDGTILTTVIATSNGTVSTTITVPATASLGTHQIQLVGQTSAFSPKTVFYVVKSSSTPSSTITEFPLPNASSYPYGIKKGSDGNLLFTESGTDKIGRITP